MNALFAQLHADDLNNLGIPTVAADQNALNAVLNTVYTWAGIIAVIVIIIAGFVYTTSGGDAANVKKAKNAITYAVIGLIVIILAFTITNFVVGKF